jgi:hypothetical protein
MLRRSLLLVCSPLVLFAACHHEHHVVQTQPPSPRLVSLQVEAFDPATNLAWQGVGVRIAQATLEWSGLTMVNPDPTVRIFTDNTGVAFFSAADLADAAVGFVEDSFGRAVLEPDSRLDQAVVTVELSAPGFPTVLADVDLSWSVPDVFVSVPFSPL